MTEERKDRERETEPKPKGDERLTDLKSQNLNRDEEGKVKGGASEEGHRADIIILS